MSRWPDDAEERLHRAAIDLFDDKGYGRTTVTEIARRAGLTERSFFNHFRDKREVLFVGRDRYIAAIAAAIDAAPADRRPFDAATDALFGDTGWYDERRDVARRRRRIIDANPELREREAAKMADLSAAIAASLAGRSTGPTDAALTAAAAVVAFQLASHSWLTTGGRSFADHAGVVVTELRHAARTW